jgi:hypothetical protein
MTDTHSYTYLSIGKGISDTYRVSCTEQELEGVMREVEAAMPGSCYAGTIEFRFYEGINCETRKLIKTMVQ